MTDRMNEWFWSRQTLASSRADTNKIAVRIRNICLILLNEWMNALSHRINLQWLVRWWANSGRTSLHLTAQTAFCFVGRASPRGPLCVCWKFMVWHVAPPTAYLLCPASRLSAVGGGCGFPRPFSSPPTPGPAIAPSPIRNRECDSFWNSATFSTLTDAIPNPIDPPLDCTPATSGLLEWLWPLRCRLHVVP